MADIQAKKRLKTTHNIRPIEDIIATNSAASMKPSIILPKPVKDVDDVRSVENIVGHSVHITNAAISEDTIKDTKS